MSVFMIVSEIPQPALRAAIEAKYPERHFHWSDTVSFVRAAGTARAVAGTLGIQSRDNDGNVISGFTRTVVSQLSPSYSGWTKASLWEWLKTAFEAAD